MKVSDDVLAVLSRCRTAGNAVHLPEQLDRKLYVAVNKVLEALGSKWNRKARAHLLDGDAEGVLDTVLLTGTVTIAADEFGLFETPAPLADRLVSEIGVEAGHRVLEPSAGNGRIALAVLRREPDVMLHAVELQPKCADRLRAVLPAARTCVYQRDFLEFEGGDYDRIFMNPPFMKQSDLKHVTRAFRMLRRGGALAAIVSAGVLFRQNTLTDEFRALVERQGHMKPLPPHSFKESGTSVNTAMVVLVN